MTAALTKIIPFLIQSVGLDDGDVKQAVKAMREALVVLYVAIELIKAVLAGFPQ